MLDKQHVDLLIIGSGEACRNLAWAMAKAGQSVAVVERKLIGGSCPNIACLPSKNIIHSAKVAQFVHRAGSPQFTHVATDDFRIACDNLNGGTRTTQGRLVPFCIFTDPELARVGMSESEARKLEISYRVATIPMTKVRRTVTLSETRGFLKALISTENDEILGFTALGAEAGEVMSVVQTAMLAKLPYTSLRDAIFAHPTMAEGLTVLFSAVPARSSALTTQSRRGRRDTEAVA
jgi:pyruvate/2-oxoglutarate dehydrogenase complex dihydrolipoamide dehydrogenase (E3) component